jgi:type VI secretion system protein ImpG
MSKPSDKDLLYYHRELSFLRHMGKAFAQKYPKIARRLNFMEQKTSDPHLERLIESFAFLTGYLQKDIENQVPRFSSALLHILYPHLMSPIPPMSIAQFKPANAKPATSSYKVPRHFSLYTDSKSNDMCYFRTGYETEVWPVEVANVELINAETVEFVLSPHAHLIKISLKALKTPFNKLDIKSLRFYINGTSIEQSILHQLLFEEDSKIALEYKKDLSPKILPEKSIKSVGFNMDENLIPCPPNAHPAYGLLQEYFCFPRKFMFFDLENLDFSQATEEAFIYIPVRDSSAAQSITFTPYRLMLGCTPIVNLFPRTSEPLRFDHKKIEYRMVPDYRREITTEIHSIEKLFMSSLNDSEVHEIQPYFSYTHKDTLEGKTVFWSARRTPTINPDVPGTDIWLSFVNWDLKPEIPPADVVYASLLCTNRELASLLAPNTLLKTNDPVPMESIICLHEPTDTSYPPEDGQTQWQLISSLAVNYLSFSSGTESLRVLKEILRLFNIPQHESRNLAINCLKELETKPIVRRFGTDVWRGFTKGTSVTLSVDEKDPHGGLEVFLFSQVLSHFFGLYSQINSFTELTLKSIHRERGWKTWPARAGERNLI